MKTTNDKIEYSVSREDIEHLTYTASSAEAIVELEDFRFSIGREIWSYKKMVLTELQPVSEDVV